MMHLENILKAELIGPISPGESTATEGREKPVKKSPKEKPAPRARGRSAGTRMLRKQLSQW
jgi:hypothetical protein